MTAGQHTFGDLLVIVPDGGLARLGRVTNIETHEDGSATITLVEPNLAVSGLGYMAPPDA